MVTFWGNFAENKATSYFIWSHWTLLKIVRYLPTEVPVRSKLNFAQSLLHQIWGLKGEGMSIPLLPKRQNKNVNYADKGSGCGAVGRAVASDTRDPQFESSHWQLYRLSTVLKAVLKRQN